MLTSSNRLQGKQAETDNFINSSDNSGSHTSPFNLANIGTSYTAGLQKTRWPRLEHNGLHTHLIGLFI